MRNRFYFLMPRLARLPGLLLALVVLCHAGRPLAPAAESTGPVFYLVPFSHLDLFWGGTREEDLARGCQIISKAVRMAKESPKFHFLLEDEVFVANYVESHVNSPELADLKRLVKEGRIEISPKWAGIFLGLPSGEALVRNMMLGKRYAHDIFGVDPLVAHMGDIPGYTKQYPQILKQSRVPYMMMPRMGPTNASLFHYQSPDGSSVLTWNALKGYGWGTFLTSKTTTDDEKRQRLQRDLADLRRNYTGPIFMNWGSDLFVPADDLVTQVDKFDLAGSPTRVAISTPTPFFHEAEKTPNIPVMSGEIPDSWPNIVPSLPHVWPFAAPATATLLSAEKFATINYALGFNTNYPQAEFEHLWKRLLEAMDHNHDGQGGRAGDNRKIEFEQLSVIRGGEILRDSLRNIAERVQVPISNSVAIVVFNPLNWTRDDVVRTHLTVYGDPAPGNINPYRKGMRLLDENGKPVPFQVEEYSENISRAMTLVFPAHGVPSLGYKTYYLVAADQPDDFPKAAVALDDDNDRLDVRHPLGVDKVENSFYRLSVDRATGRVTLFDKDLGRDVCKDMEIVANEERGGNYIGIEPLSGRTLLASCDNVVLEEHNAARTILRVTCRIADILMTQRLILPNEIKRLDIENTVEWKTPRFVRVEQLFPMADKDYSLHYGIPFGQTTTDDIMPHTGPRAGDEIKPDSWHNSRIVHDWIYAAMKDWGLNLSTDHQQVRLTEGVIRAEMTRGTRYTSVKVVRGGEVGSMFYPPPGAYVFHYSLTSGKGDWKSTKPYRTGMNWNNPLIAISVMDAISTKPLPPTHSFCAVNGDNLVISALKKEDLGSAVLLRFYETEGSPAEAQVEFLGRRPAFSEVNLLEEDTNPAPRQALPVAPYAIKTVKLESATPLSR